MFTKIRRTDVKKFVIVLVWFVDGKLSAPMRNELREGLYFEVLELRFSNCYLKAIKLICLHHKMFICLSVCQAICYSVWLLVSLAVCLSGCQAVWLSGCSLSVCLVVWLSISPSIFFLNFVLSKMQLNVTYKRILCLQIFST